MNDMTRTHSDSQLAERPFRTNSSCDVVSGVGDSGPHKTEESRGTAAGGLDGGMGITEIAQRTIQTLV